MLRNYEIILQECKQNLQGNLIINQEIAKHHAWLITDGKAGDLNACKGVAQWLNLSTTIKNVNKKSYFKDFFSVVMKPRVLLNSQEIDFSEPFPEIIIASGRRSAPIMWAIKLLSPKTFCVFLKNPYIYFASADFVWQPLHDTHRKKNVTTSILSPHHLRISEYKLGHSQPKIVGVLVGGESKHAHWRDRDCEDFIKLLQHHGSKPYIVFKILISRRTPENLHKVLKSLCENTHHKCFTPSIEKPHIYSEIIQEADALIVTADSINMLSESLSRGCSVYIFQPKLKQGRVLNHIAKLIEEKLVKPLNAHLEFSEQDPLNVTPAIAIRVAQAYMEFNIKNNHKIKE